MITPPDFFKFAHDNLDIVFPGIYQGIVKSLNTGDNYIFTYSNCAARDKFISAYLAWKMSYYPIHNGIIFSTSRKAAKNKLKKVWELFKSKDLFGPWDPINLNDSKVRFTLPVGSVITARDFWAKRIPNYQPDLIIISGLMDTLSTSPLARAKFFRDVLPLNKKYTTNSMRYGLRIHKTQIIITDDKISTNKEINNIFKKSKIKHLGLHTEVDKECGMQ